MTDSNAPQAGSVPASDAPPPRSGDDARKRRALRFALPAAVVAGGLLLTLVSVLDGDDPVKVKLPKPPFDSIKSMCKDLDKQLPDQVLGHDARKTVPASNLTAAWGNPAIVLRCGVPMPVSLRPDDPNYAPEQNAIGVDGVRWTFEFLGEGKGVRLTTLHREVNVEVTVPAAYAEPGGVVTAFADAVKRTVPATNGEES
ncbi:DUF3515 domain-containing protein [Yinghuangia sp. ASG 101]|uniref:DUF3515 domain-containing protein n=1 Tax=Yinghuangia sp. ASG 101 TaxID=2896848 RepID=UPI001E5DFE57|nr:DUF3515 domain-containing protein [Yinghuangia sp. ASG 101]UGQ14147.1 DUF3515 domain-containing protein [Yinghuangia sp. ASG 101]